MTDAGDYRHATIPTPLHMLTYPFRALAARLLGYFWLPCPLCNRKFAGFQWGDRRERPSTIPREASWHMGKGICPTCTRQGLGYDAWPAAMKNIDGGVR